MKSIRFVILLFLLAILQIGCGKGNVKNNQVPAEEPEKTIVNENLTLMDSKALQLHEIIRFVVEDPEMGRFLSGSVSLDTSGNRVILLDQEQGRFFAYDLSGRLLFQGGGKGQGPGQFQSPTGLALLPDGSFIVIEAHPLRMSRFDSQGLFVLARDLSLGVLGQTYIPQSAVVGPNGHIYFLGLQMDGTGYSRWILDQNPDMNTSTLLFGGAHFTFDEYKRYVAHSRCAFDVSENGTLALTYRQVDRLELLLIQRDQQQICLHLASDRILKPENQLTDVSEKILQLKKEGTAQSDMLFRYQPIVRQLCFDETGRLWIRMAVSPTEDAICFMEPGSNVLCKTNLLIKATDGAMKIKNNHLCLFIPSETETDSASIRIFNIDTVPME